jgi:hypothetical protein
MALLIRRIEDLLLKADFRPVLINKEEGLNLRVKSLSSERPREVYQMLGGKGDWTHLEPILPQIDSGSGFMILDEANHFNRYRLVTLRSDLYDQHCAFKKSDYQRFCRTFERECIKAATHENAWTTGVAEKHFGKAAEPGDFFGNGSPEWKLKAFQHFLTDHFTSSNKIALARLSIYDTVLVNKSLVRLDRLLMSGNMQNEEILKKYLTRRIIKAATS